MMGYNVRNLKTFTSFSLETLVPEDNFYRQVEECINLSFVRNLVCHLYSAFGRPSIRSVLARLARRLTSILAESTIKFTIPTDVR